VPPAEAAPLADGELEALFAPLAEASLIALAVSGGSDSLALLDGIDRWRRGVGRPGVIVFTVDHRLRPQSGRDAAMVRKVARARGLKTVVLVRDGPPPKSDIEAAARWARYRLLLGACRAAGASHLVLAHHRDDLAETFVLRLKRASGVFGLAAMRSSITAGEVTIVRPLLSLSKARLAATAAAAGLVAVDDAMNDDPRFERTRVRRMMPTFGALGLAADALAASAQRLAAAADAIDAAASDLIARAVSADDCAVAWIEVPPLASAAAEVRLRALARVLIAVGGDDYPPRRERLAALLDAILAHAGGGRFKRTLAGAVIEWRSGRLAIYRESGRKAPPTVAARPGLAGTWDHRFHVEVGAGVPAGLSLGALGEAGRRAIGRRAGTHPAGAIATLPAFRRRGKIIAVPPLSYGPEGFSVVVRALVGERLKTPPLFPDFG